MTLHLYFLRHGQTVLSRDNLFCGAGTNPELTADGSEMAQAFATGYKALPWTAIFTSPQLRACQTVKPLCEALGRRANERPELKEIDFGAWDGLGPDEISKRYHDDFVRWSADPAWNAPTKGESAITVARRVRPLIEEIRATIPDGNVLLVSHKGTIRIALCDLLGIDVSRFRDRLACPVGSVSIVEFGSRGPLLKALADRGHLSDRLKALPGT